MLKQRYNTYLILAFTGLLGLVFTLNLMEVKVVDNGKENRKLKEFPDLEISNLENFPKEYEAFYNDNHSFRGLWNLWYSYISYQIGKREQWDKVIKTGKDFFLPGMKEAKLYMGDIMFSADEEVGLQNELSRRKAYCEERGCQYYVVIIPTKYEVFDETVPSCFKIHQAKKTRLDQLIEQSELAGVECLDLRTIFKNIDTEDLYHKYDVHWNGKGGLLASVAMRDMLQNDFPQIPSYTFSDFKPKYRLRKGGDLATVLNASSFITEDDYTYWPIDTNLKLEKGEKRGYEIKNFVYANAYENVRVSKCNDCPKALIIRDSFAPYVIPFLSQSFSESVYIWDKWQYAMNEEIFEKEQPEVFIQMVYEPYVNKLLNSGFKD